MWVVLTSHSMASYDAARPDEGGLVIANRSVPKATVIPELAYADVTKASDWLCEAFGFKIRLRIGNHRAQLVFGDGAMVAIELGDADPRSDAATHAMLVRVEDADHHHEQAAGAGARILSPPTDYRYGERQYTAVDVGGHHWTFSQSIADVDPASWGGELATPEA
jgi:uncharacterized glyoxalase superfamily protein PhnB